MPPCGVQLEQMCVPAKDHRDNGAIFDSLNRSQARRGGFGLTKKKDAGGTGSCFVLQNGARLNIGINKGDPTCFKPLIDARLFMGDPLKTAKCL